MSDSDNDALDSVPVGVKITKVLIDALALEKIVNHCKDSCLQQQGAAGQLLGLDDSNGQLHVTNCFPFPQDSVPAASGSDETSMDAAEYQMTMMRSLRDVGLDANPVGWYQSNAVGSSMSTSNTLETVETQFNYQQEISPQSILITYDPIKSSYTSTISLSAHRLSDEFISFYKEGNKKFTLESIKKLQLSFSDIFESIPVQVQNSALASALMYQISPLPSFDRLNIRSNVYLEKNLELLGECFDSLSQDQYKWNRYLQQVSRQQQALYHHMQRRKLENQKRVEKGEKELPEEDLLAMFKPIQEPSRLDLLLLDNQMSQYCNQINQFSATAFTKLHAAKEMQTLN